MTKDVHQELIDKFKDEPFSVIDKQGTILNKTHLSSMGYATHVPYSVIGLDDLLTSINELAHKKEDLEKENEQLRIEKDNIQKQHSYELTKKLEYKSKLIDLKKENEQLKKALVELKEIGDYQYGRIKELSDENEKLKEEIKDLNDVLARYEEKELKE